MAADLIVDYCGSIAGVTPMTSAGRDWVSDNLTFEPWQLTGCTINCDLRCADAIADGAEADGLTVDR